MADSLHFGTFGGLWTKIIWFLFGAALTAMAVTGTIIYATRLAKDSRTDKDGWQLAWRGMGIWAYIGIPSFLWLWRPPQARSAAQVEDINQLMPLSFLNLLPMNRPFGVRQLAILGGGR